MLYDEYIHASFIMDFQVDEQTNLVYTDFYKDRVDHKLLLHKLYYAGFPIVAVVWLKSCLTGRT